MSLAITARGKLYRNGKGGDQINSIQHRGPGESTCSSLHVNNEIKLRLSRHTTFLGKCLSYSKVCSQNIDFTRVP